MIRYTLYILMRSRDLIAEIEALGWVLDRKRGSHHVFKHPTLRGNLSVLHPKDNLGTGLVQKLRKFAEEGYAISNSN